MPEYLAPGVFVEEVSFRQKPIEGVSTSTTAFVGPTRDGPIYGEPPLLTSFKEFSDIYGGLDPVVYNSAPVTNFLAHAVRAYFEEGGKRLYIARVYNAPGGDVAPGTPATQTGGIWSDGIARWQDASSIPPDVDFWARYPGAMGNRLVTLGFRVGANVLERSTASVPEFPARLKGLSRYDVVWVQSQADAAASTPDGGDLYWVDTAVDPEGRPILRLRQGTPGAAFNASLPEDIEESEFETLQQVRPIVISVTSESSPTFRGRFDLPKTYEALGFYPGFVPPGSRMSLSEQFAETPNRRSISLLSPLVFQTSLTSPSAVAGALIDLDTVADAGTVREIIEQYVVALGQPDDQVQREFIRSLTENHFSARLELTGGGDGTRPDAGEYQGREGTDGNKNGLLALEDLEDISIVAAPGSSYLALSSFSTDSRAITLALLSHCERMRYRVAVLDSPDGALPGEVREQRGKLDSKYGALYYPWVRTFDPVTESELLLPPSGFIAGIYARNDVDRGVQKAPANEVIRLALGFEILLNKGQQEVLNPEGINCLRFFEGRGFRVWGARTISSDAEWRYINLRRNFAYLGRSIEIGTQWAVFEPNAEELWANVRRAVEDFLYNEWRSDRLMGVTPEEAFFVRCDRTTMTQNDIDFGRLICLVGVALLKPAEFVIFRIGQKTLDFKG